MEQMKIMIYVTLCVELILSFVEGSSFYKYLKLFGYLIVMYVCCMVFFAFSKSSESLLIEQMKQIETISELVTDWEVFLNGEQ